MARKSEVNSTNAEARMTVLDDDYEMPKQTRVRTAQHPLALAIATAIEDGRVRVVESADWSDEQASKFLASLRYQAKKAGVGVRFARETREGHPAQGHYVWKVKPLTTRTRTSSK